MPQETMYHRWVGWHAPALRRLAIVASVGLIVTVGLLVPATWELALIGGWDASALAFLLSVWPIIVKADGARTQRLAMREDETRSTAALLIVGASVISLLTVGFALGQAGREDGGTRALLIGVATVTVVLSWIVVNTVFTLRYAHLYFSGPPGAITFGDSSERQQQPTYRDFAYVAFTIGMTYQVSDTTLRNRRFRRAVLCHSVLSYVFGVVIVAGSVNLIAGLVS